MRVSSIVLGRDVAVLRCEHARVDSRTRNFSSLAFETTWAPMRIHAKWKLLQILNRGAVSRHWHRMVPLLWRGGDNIPTETPEH